MKISRILIKTVFITTLCISSSAFALTSSLAWQLLPENLEDLPIESETDATGYWSEMWMRHFDLPEAQPHSFMEQTLGLKWMGLDPDKSGRPTLVVMVLGNKSIIEIKGDKIRSGKLESGGDKISWSDGSKQDLVGFKKRSGGRRKRSRAAKKVNFGKIVLPAIASKPSEISPWSMAGFEEMLLKIPGGSDSLWTSMDLGVIHRLLDNQSSVLKFRYAPSCSQSDREVLEKIISQEVEPKLSCWSEQNPKKALLLISALMQKPILDCQIKNEENVCGKATLPYTQSFFITQPKISLKFGKCKDSIGNTTIHEVLHLVGVNDGEEMDNALAQSESCVSQPGKLELKGSEDEFFNDLQVETRILLFRKIREQAVENWGWSDGEKAYVLAQLCTRMNDKFCARRFFQLATEAGGSGFFSLPEGGEVSFSAAAHFGLFDSIMEDLPRMHELTRYLARDPNGTLLRRMEVGGMHRVHEFFVARSTLEQVKENKGICNGSTDDRVTCEDLSTIVKTPWFKNP